MYAITIQYRFVVISEAPRFSNPFLPKKYDNSPRSPSAPAPVYDKEGEDIYGVVLARWLEYQQGLVQNQFIYRLFYLHPNLVSRVSIDHPISCLCSVLVSQLSGVQAPCSSIYVYCVVYDKRPSNI